MGPITRVMYYRNIPNLRFHKTDESYKILTINCGRVTESFETMYHIVKIFRKYSQSIVVFCPRAGLSMQTQHSPLYPLLSLPFRIFIQSIYHNVCLSSDIFFCLELSSHLPYLLEQGFKTAAREGYFTKYNAL